MGIMSNFHATSATSMGKHWHMPDFKCKSVNFNNLFRNKFFGLK